MSYFDHVKCHHCGTQLNPDNLSAGMACPACGKALALTDLFGVADAFSEHDQTEATLDDLLAPQKAYADDPLRDVARQQHEAHAERRRARASGNAPPTPAPAAPGSTGMVHRPAADDDDDDVGGTPSALELMRRMKKGR